MDIMRLEVSGFGPIKNCSFDIEKFMVLIGPQGTGKSTLSKLVFYFLNLRDEIAGYILDTYEEIETLDTQGLNQRLTDRFREFFGPTPNSKDINITFFYGNGNELRISGHPQDHRFIFFEFNPKMMRDIYELFDSLRDEFRQQRPSGIFSTFELEKKRDDSFKTFNRKCADVFGFDQELLFIPAGRSSLPVFSEQVGIINTHMLDYPMRKFIARIIPARSRFGRTIDKIISESVGPNGTPVDESTFHRAKDWVRSILKGEYLYVNGEERLYIDQDLFLKINLASSGQQEVLWLLMFLFSMVVDRIKTIVFIEEPEAHLFPEAQRKLVEFISFVHSNSSCDFFITTHSPYILTSANNLIYAHSVGQVSEKRAQEIIPKDIWLPPEDVGGYFVHHGELEELYVPELQMFKSELIDETSRSIEELFDRLSDIEDEGLHE